MALCAAVLVAAIPALAASPAAQFKPRQLSAFDRRKAEVLLSTKLPCLGCHELNGSGGRIGPSLTDVRSRRSPSYIFAMIKDPRQHGHHLHRAPDQPGAPDALMPLVPMDRSTRDLIANYLLQHDGSLVRATTADPPVHPGAAAPVPGDAATLYARMCSPCHGVRGGGDGFNRPFLPVRPAVHASTTAMSARSDDALFDTISAGGYIMNRSPFMPPFGRTLTRDQIWGLVKHIRSLCGCDGPAWSRDTK